ncbi:MAG: hypothetical protein AAFP07_17945 [Cyanobacteria bacterium J06606_4]
MSSATLLVDMVRRRRVNRRHRRRLQRRLRRLIFHYFNSSWLPGVICLAASLLAMSAIANSLQATSATSTAFSSVVWAMGWFLGGGLLLAFCGLLGSTVWNLSKQRWGRGSANFALLVLVCTAVTTAIGNSLLFATAGDYEPEAVAAYLPKRLEAQTPKRRTPVDLEMAAVDDFQGALLSALGTAAADGSTITATVSSLQYLHEHETAVLKRYLAAHPAWRLFEERDRLYATRRWKIGSDWRYTLHGYYSSSDIKQALDRPYFQARFTIGLSGKPWLNNVGDMTWLAPGETAAVKLSEGSLHSDQSISVIEDQALVIEIFEESVGAARPLTQAALDFTETEFGDLAYHPTWENIRYLLPPGSVQTGAPSLELYHAVQPGLYDATIWANPGEPGKVYLKAFNARNGITLSTHRLAQKTNEWIGWSDDPDELFLSNTYFTLHGEVGRTSDAVRLEVWFEPDGGGADRKLLEKVFDLEAQ